MCLNNAQYSNHSLQMSTELHQLQISKASKDRKLSTYLESLPTYDSHNPHIKNIWTIYFVNPQAQLVSASLAPKFPYKFPYLFWGFSTVPPHLRLGGLWWSLGVCPIGKGKTCNWLRRDTGYTNLVQKRVHHQRSYIRMFTDSHPEVFQTTLINISTHCLLGPNAVACSHCLGHSTGIGCFSPCSWC